MFKRGIMLGAAALGVSHVHASPSSFHELGSSSLKQYVLEQCAIYPRTSEQSPDVNVIDTYDGTTKSFSAACARVAGNPLLKAVLGTNIVQDVLATVARAPEEYCLSQIDAVVLCSCGDPVVRINRLGYDTKFAGGRCLRVDLNDVRHQSTDLLMKKQLRGYSIVDNNVMLPIACAALAMGALYISRR